MVYVVSSTLVCWKASLYIFEYQCNIIMLCITQSHCAAAAYDYSLANPIFDDLNVHLIQTPSTKLFILEVYLVVYLYFDKKRNGNLNTISHPKTYISCIFWGVSRLIRTFTSRDRFWPRQVRISATVLYAQIVCLVMWRLHYFMSYLSNLQKFGLLDSCWSGKTWLVEDVKVCYIS